MKQIVFGIACVVIMILFAVALMTIEGQVARENELDNSLYSAMSQTMFAQENTLYGSFKSDQAMREFFTDSLMTSVCKGDDDRRDEALNVSVDVLGLDRKKGLLSARVIEDFSYPNGAIGHVVREGTMIAEKKVIKHFTVTFMVDYSVTLNNAEYSVRRQRVLKKLILLEGDRVVLPKICRDYEWVDSITGDKVSSFPQNIESNKYYQ